MLNEKNNWGLKPIMIAAQSGHFGIVKKMIEKDESLMLERENDGTTLLNYLSNHPTLFKQVVEYDASLLKEKSSYGSYPIHEVYSYNRFDLVYFLLEKDLSQIFLKDGDGRILIHRVAQNKLDYDTEQLFDWLLEKDPSQLEVLDNEGCHLIHWLANGSNFKQIKELLEQKPSCASVKSKSGTLPIFYVNWSGNSRFLKWFFAKFPEQLMTTDGYSGDLPIHWACRYGDEEFVEWMLEQVPKLELVK